MWFKSVSASEAFWRVVVYLLMRKSINGFWSVATAFTAGRGMWVLRRPPAPVCGHDDPDIHADTGIKKSEFRSSYLATKRKGFQLFDQLGAFFIPVCIVRSLNPKMNPKDRMNLK